MTGCDASGRQRRQRVVLGPRLEGGFGWAQQITCPDDPFASVQAGSWFMWLPNQGIAWSHFMLAVIALKEVAGQPAAHRRYPQAEYELMLQALGSDPEPDIRDTSTWQPLDPVNVVIQFHGLSMAQAAQVGEAAAWWCVRGRLPAETQTFVRTGDSGKMMTIVQAVQLWEQSVQQLVFRARAGRIPGRDS